jgi:hypothetical protein
MNSFFKTIIAGWGAKKLGGGCLSTIIIFVLIYMALGQCDRTPQRSVSVHKAPTSQEVAAIKHN